MARMNATPAVRRKFALARGLLRGALLCRDARRSGRDRDAKSRLARELRRQRDAHRVRNRRARRRNAFFGAHQSRSGRDDPARQRAGVAHRAAFAGADRRGRLRLGARARGWNPDPSGRQLQRQRAIRGELRAGRRDRGPARAWQRPLRLERRARHHQRDPAHAGGDPGLWCRHGRRQRRIRAAADRGLERDGQRRLRHRDARHRRRWLARLVRFRGGKAQCGVDAHAGRRAVEALARGIEPQPGDGRLHRRPERLPRPADRAFESRSRRLPQRAEPAFRRAVSRSVGHTRRACSCAARAWISSSISCSASRSRTTARTAAA